MANREKTMQKQRIGFIGLGIMGQPMCLNLLKAGFPLTVYNRTAERMKSIVDAGARGLGSPGQVAAQSDVIITMVTDSPDVVQVVTGENGILSGLQPGTVVIDMSTISPTVTQQLSEHIEAQGCEMLDAPVSGGDTGARAGALAIMVGGKAEVYERCLPVFQAMGKSITHVGGHGMGQTVKLCNQILVSVTNLAVCEAIQFASRSGVDPEVMIKATQGGAAGSWQLTNLGPRMVARDFAPGFMIDLQQKDLKLALEAARQIKLPLPALALVHQLFAGCQANDEGREGTQALIKSLMRLAGDSAVR
ncbi:NAD(P)-dependent oxidoreductase [candidate division KSB1 bacterium]|nr:NAD(P)-dependent oxidoreductase [candidate division KSB1 bacterium]